MLGNVNMCQIVRMHSKYANMCQMIRHARICNGVTIHVEEYQGDKKEKQVKIQGNEHFIGLISHQFTFSKRGMICTPTLGGNECQVPSVSAFYVPNHPLLLLFYFPVIDLK